MVSKVPDSVKQFEILSKEETLALPDTSKEEEGLIKWMIEKIDAILKASKGDPTITFKEYSKRISRLSEISGDLPTQELKDKISIFAIQYLLKGAKIPLLPGDQNKFNLPILDYSEVMNPTYYRSDESSLNKIYESLLQRPGQYAFLFDKTNKWTLGFVKSPKFKRFLQAHFDWEKFKPTGASFDEQLNELNERLKRGLTDKEVLDLSYMLSNQGEALQPKELESRTKQINQALSGKMTDKTKVFAEAKLMDGQHIILVFNENQQLSASLRRMKQKGYRPDLPLLEKSLIAQHFDEHLLAKAIASGSLNVGKKKRETKEYSLDEVLDKLKSLSKLTNMKLDKYPVYNYYGFLASFLLATKNLQNTHVTTLNDASKKIIQQSVEIIYKKLEKHEKKLMNHEEIPFNDLLTDIDLIAEEIILQLCFIDTPDLKETINQLMKKHVKVEGLEVEPQSYVYTSGMNSLAQVIFATHRSKRPKEMSKVEGGAKKPPDTPIELGIVENIYFETRESFLEKIERIMHQTEFDLNAEAKEKLPEVIFADLYSNNAPKPQAEKTNFKIMFPINKLRESAPVTLIIDTSTTMFYDEAVKKIVEGYKDLINDGSLNLVFVNSLAKFSMCGLDKYQGGAVVVYNKGNMNTEKTGEKAIGGEVEFVKFNQQLAKYEGKEPISSEASAFFHLFLKTGNEILKYKSLINENTTHVFTSLIGKTEKSSSDLKALSGEVIKNQYTLEKLPETFPKGIFLIDRKSKRIPSISIHIGTILEDIILSKRAEAAKKQELQQQAQQAKTAGRGKKVAAQGAPGKGKQRILSIDEQNKIKERDLKKLEADVLKLKIAFSPILVEYIAMKGRTANLPLYLRQSFGFMHSGIAECANALRLTVGLEEKETLDQYATILKELNKELEEIANDPTLMKKLENILTDKFKKHFVEEIANLKKTTSLKELIQSFSITK